jgi:hypothetical protein
MVLHLQQMQRCLQRSVIREKAEIILKYRKKEVKTRDSKAKKQQQTLLKVSKIERREVAKRQRC